ncbi:MAG TPA: hypothetical protein VH417_17650 [Vicinamibacterales bacterium]|jgi:hypothetical protein
MARAARITVGRQRLMTRAVIAHQRTLRQLVGKGIRRALREHRAAVIQSLRGPAGGAAPVRRGGVWELCAEPVTDEPTASSESPEAQVLRAIERHPHGVRAIDIGNELGLDWRHVLAVARGLVQAGKADEVQNEFYPRRKASRRT